MTARVLHLVIPGYTPPSWHSQCFSWGNQTTKRLQLRQLVITNHLHQESICKQQVQSIPISGCMQSVRGSSHSQQFHMYWERDCNQWGVLSMTKDHSRCQMIIVALDNLQNKQIYGMNFTIPITLYQRQSQFPRLRNGNSIFLPHSTVIYKII